MTQNKYQSLSQIEQFYQFLYLVILVIIAEVLLGFLCLSGYSSPFSKNVLLDVQLLEQKYKFKERQKLIEPLVTSTFLKINVLKYERPQPFVENDIASCIAKIANSFANTSIYDPRKEAYTQIGYFYKMYLNDKKILAKKTENIQLFHKQFEECSIGFKDKKQQLDQRKITID